ncbi:MAG TPA: D-alanyl-D-alanine carboxypeptidase/D-alanyl-D-alanine-endopeptidase [Pyrinomonadaceae bacterium]|jgi:D-alanyl-D-alanine carboxypeptidase/D-alanyl-D-alanine-endopeptidase (penicillin-binding protein 4)
MIKIHNRQSSGLFLLVLLALNTGAVAPTLAQGAPLEQQQRERRTSTASPNPSPGASPTPALVAATATAPVAINAPKTLTELQSRIEEVMRQPDLAPGIFAVKVASLDTGRTLFAENEDKLLRPASNMKIYTVATALDRLTPDYRFVTSVYALDKPDKSGTIKGDLIIYGRGDPSIAARFNNGDYFKGINDLADRIAAAGVKRVKGDLVGDESYFNGAPLGSGWEWEDLQWWYGAEVSALTVNDNSLDLSVKPGSKVGAPCVITTGPPAPFVSITNRTLTSAAGAKSELSVYRGPGENVLEISGSLPLGDQGYTGGVAVPDPALVFVSMLRASLQQRGVIVTGRIRTVDARSNSSVVPAQNVIPQNVGDIKSASSGPLVEITNMQSPPLKVIAAQTLKPSQNLYTELILRTLGKVAGTNPKQTNEQAGLEIVKSFLRQAGVGADEIVLSDGSGLSRNDMVMASASLQLLTYMSRHRYADIFRDALPIAGVDGTLRSRMKGTPAAGNLRAKTGTLSSVASLSGYVTSAAGEHLVFSMMLNNYADANAVRKDSIDAIAVLLASFAGRS